MKRFLGCCAIAAVAWWIAKGLGLPDWRTWEPGDAFDISIFSFAAALILSEPRRT